MMKVFVGTLVALLVGAVAVLVAFGMTWATVVAPVFGGPVHGNMNTEIALSGRELAPGGSAAGWVALAGVAGLIATRAWGRRLVGAIVGLAGGVAGVTSLTFGLTGSAFVDAAVAARGAQPPLSVTPTLWWILGAVGGLLILVGGLVAVLRGPSWPGLSGRYERDGNVVGTETAGPISSLAAWDALDRGEDPTDPAAGAG